MAWEGPGAWAPMPHNAHYQWQYVDATSGAWTNYNGATGATFVVPSFLLLGGLGVRVNVHYVDNKGYTEQLYSAPTITAITPAAGNTPPFLNAGTQFNGISNTSATVGQTLDFFTPLTSIFNDAQTTPDLLIYTATLANGAALSTVGLQFKTLPGVLAPPGGVGASLAGEFSTIPGATLSAPGPIAVRVKATDAGGLSVTNTFTINVVPANSPPNAVNDSYTTLENFGLQTLPSQSVLHNDTDPNLDTFTAQLVTGPSNGTLVFNPDGTFIYTPNHNFFGADFVHLSRHRSGWGGEQSSDGHDQCHRGGGDGCTDQPGGDDLAHGHVEFQWHRGWFAELQLGQFHRRDHLDPDRRQQHGHLPAIADPWHLPALQRELY